MWPGSMRRVLALWMSWSAWGIEAGGGGSASGGPETVEMVTVSPLSIVAAGANVASR
jgi:hypothetical protein